MLSRGRRRVVKAGRAGAMTRASPSGVRARLVPWLIRTGARLTRPLTVGVRGVVLDGSGRVFLVRHGYVPGWQFPGGGVEAGESAGAALARELEEEAGIAIRGTPLLHGICLQGRRDHVVVYVVRDFAVQGDRDPDWEIQDGRFFPVADLPHDATPATRRRLREVLDGVACAETW